MRLRDSSAASPICTVCAEGSGDVARPLAASPPPANRACAMACALVGASSDLALTRMTSRGVSLNTRLKASGLTKRKPKSPACSAAETSSAQCKGVRRRQSIKMTCPSSDNRWRAGVCSLRSINGGRLVELDGQGQRTGVFEFVITFCVVGFVVAHRIGRVVDACQQLGV